MNHITKPMLASKCQHPDALSFPVLATPKLDGIRCLKINGRALTRSFKPVSNRFTRGWIEANLSDGLDGELIVRGTTFSETAGHIGRESGEPDFTFAVFDYVTDGVDVPYVCRMQELKRLPEFEHVEKGHAGGERKRGEHETDLSLQRGATRFSIFSLSAAAAGFCHTRT